MSGFMQWQSAVIAAEKITLRQQKLQKLQKESQVITSDRLISLRILLREACTQKISRLRRANASNEDLQQVKREFSNLESEMVETFRSLDPRTAIETCQAIISSMRLWGNATVAKTPTKRSWGAAETCVVTFLLDEAEVCSWPMDTTSSDEFQVEERSYHTFQYDASDCEKRQQRQRRLLQRLPRGTFFLDNGLERTTSAAKSP